VGWHAAYWTGSLGDAETYLSQQMEVAREAGRKDLEAIAVLAKADTYSARFHLEDAEAQLELARELAEESGTISTRGRVLFAWMKLYLIKGELEQAEEAGQEATRLFSEAGAVWAVARAMNMAGWVAWERGDLEIAEKRFRESIRLLKPIGDRATLCESQRGLAELLLKRGRIDEAERFAHDARETVGPLDLTSRATTTGSLAMVRAAQGRDQEAEQLFREGLAMVADTDFRVIADELRTPFAQFLRDRGRDAEAAALEEEREPRRSAETSSARIA
jgi:tetratricopeptide (TPR) repeat protein